MIQKGEEECLQEGEPIERYSLGPGEDVCEEWTVKAWPPFASLSLRLVWTSSCVYRLYIPRNDGEEYAALTYSVFVSLSWYTTWMFVSGGSFILSSRTSSVKRPHQRSLAAAVLKEIKIGVIRPDKTDTSTVLIERCISFSPFTHLLELASLLRVSKKKKQDSFRHEAKSRPFTRGKWWDGA